MSDKYIFLIIDIVGIVFYLSMWYSIRKHKTVMKAVFLLSIPVSFIFGFEIGYLNTNGFDLTQFLAGIMVGLGSWLIASLWASAICVVSE